MRHFSTTEVKVFFLGFLACLLAVVISAVWAGTALLRQGVTITIPYEQVAITLNEQVAEQVQRVLPGYLEQARGQIPQLVAGQVSSGLGSASIQIGNYEVRLPTAVVHGLDTHLQSAVTAALIRAMDSLDTRAIARLTVEQVEQQMTVFWREHPDGFLVYYRIFERWHLPVKIKLQ